MTPLPLIITLLLLLFGASPASAAEGWTWPVRGEVLTAYANGDDPYAAGQHRGIDIGAPEGHPVVAAVGGTVTFAGSAGSSGLTVAVRTDDGRLDTSYLHLSAVDVARGDAVGGGERLGAVGVSGRRSIDAPHLHFGVREAGTDHGYLNPLDFLPPLLPPPVPEIRPVPVGVPVPAEPPPESVPVVVTPEPLPAPGLLPLPLPLARTVPLAEPVPVPEPLPLLGFEAEAAPGQAPRSLSAPQQTAGHPATLEPVGGPGTVLAPGHVLARGNPASADARAVSAPSAPRLVSATPHDPVPALSAGSAPSSGKARDARSRPSLDAAGREATGRAPLEPDHGGRMGPGKDTEVAPRDRSETAGPSEIRFGEDPAAARRASGSTFDFGRVAALVALLIAAVAVGRPVARRGRRLQGGIEPRPVGRPLPAVIERLRGEVAALRVFLGARSTTASIARQWATTSPPRSTTSTPSPTSATRTARSPPMCSPATCASAARRCSS